MMCVRNIYMYDHTLSWELHWFAEMPSCSSHFPFEIRQDKTVSSNLSPFNGQSALRKKERKGENMREKERMNTFSSMHVQFFLQYNTMQFYSIYMPFLLFPVTLLLPLTMILNVQQHLDSDTWHMAIYHSSATLLCHLRRLILVLNRGYSQDNHH